MDFGDVYTIWVAFSAKGWYTYHMYRKGYTQGGLHDGI